MKRLFTEIDIAAPPEQVWSVLTDFARYPEWNPFVISIAGVAEEGARLRIKLQPVGSRALTFRPRVTQVTEARVLEWLGRLGVPGVFDGRHTFELQPHAGGTRFVQREVFRGALVPLFARSLDRHTVPAFAAMNRALKERAEHPITASPA